LTLFSYSVFYRGQDASVSVIITDFVERIEVNDVGTGEIRSAIIRLNAQDGQFITQATSLAGEFTPIVSQFDLFEIQIVDADSKVFLETFEVNILKPIQNAQQGTVLEVQMLGRESYLMKNTFTKQFRFESGFNVARDIIDFYNDSIPKTLPVLNPTITGNQADTAGGGTNDLPKTTSNHYMFSVSELSHYDAMDQTVNKMAAPVSAGGAGNFFEHHYRSDNTIIQDLVFEGFESGNPPAQQTGGVFDPTKAVIIDDSVSVNPGEEEGGIEAILATQVAVWGQDAIGRLPTENNQFSGELEAWLSTPFHIVGELYPTGSLVQIDAGPDPEGDNEHYRANADTSTTPPGTGWGITRFSSFVTVPAYSKWTVDLNQAWKNACGNIIGPKGADRAAFADSTFNDLSAWDGNQVTVDEDFKRSYADIRSVNIATIDSDFKRTGKLYRGFRILVDTTLGAPVAPLDDFPNQLVQVTGYDSNDDEEFLQVVDFQDDNFCAVDTEANGLVTADGARVYQLVSGVWTDVSDNNVLFPDGQSNDCYHPLYNVINSQGYFNKPSGGANNFGFTSAVTFQSKYLLTDLIDLGLTATPNYYRPGAWADFKFPYPYAGYLGENIGSLYGNNDTKREPATLDQYNMHLTPSGLVGFNNTEAENLGVLDGIYFVTNFNWFAGWDNNVGQILAANFKCRCYLYDTNDTVVSSDFVIPFNNNWAPISLPFSSFKIYRARKPASLATPITDFFLQGLEVLDVFRYENIKRIAFVWLRPYDDQGRYAPISRTAELTAAFPPGAGIGLDLNARSIDWSFDYFGFSKAMLSITPPITTGRLLQTTFFQEPLIDNKFQLDQTALANLDLTQFQLREYEIVTEGRFDIPYGFSFFLKNEDIIIDEDLAGTPNTIKLVNKKTKFVIDKPPQGAGGFLRYITGVKIIES